MMRVMQERGFMITAKTIKKHWLRDNEIEIEITDGKTTLKFTNVGTFTVETDKPLYEQLLYKEN